MSRNDLRVMTAVLARRVQLASLLLLGCASLAVAADKVAEVSDDFLEYLGTLAAEDESWMDVVVEATKSQAQVNSKAKATTSNDSKVVASASSSASSHAQTQPQPIAHAASVNSSAASKTGKVEK